MRNTYTQEEVEKIVTASKHYLSLRQYDPANPFNFLHKKARVFDSALERDVQFAKETLETIEKYPKFFNSDATEVIQGAYRYLNSALKQQREFERKLKREKKENIHEIKEIGKFYNTKKLKSYNTRQIIGWALGLETDKIK